ncbi:hypothetical protein ACH5RR_023411 [Cinchona calisaya]|uniref:Uncharacterized protein n=1 Tax=Cinchona calisaya TaxID=153742 RepID=A0ABD2ZAL3_9GENT
MEVAVIDWKCLDSRFVKDDIYENISAPQWVDFSAPDASIDVESWFCRPDCNHPKRVEDFFKEATPNSMCSASASEILPLRERNREYKSSPYSSSVYSPSFGAFIVLFTLFTHH